MNLSNPLSVVRGLAPNYRPNSLRSIDRLVLWLESAGAGHYDQRLGVLCPATDKRLQEFEGKIEMASSEMRLLRAPLSAKNAAAVRKVVPNLMPGPLSLETSVGFGDRLGVATPGHARALRAVGAEGSISAVFAQQSIREMERTGRSPREVLDDATWGALSVGWEGKVGADADHLKTTEDVAACAAAGFTMFTLDPGDLVDDSSSTASETELRSRLGSVPWGQLNTTEAEHFRRYEGKKLVIEGLEMRPTSESIARATAKYGAALAHVGELHTFIAGIGTPYEIEISVDETDSPTSLEEHVLIALELERLGVPIVSLAPRFVGRFEKGIDYRGDLDELVRTLNVHAAIARAMGPYKLSLHSGSDKFSVYRLIADATRGRVHLKTAGTSYLEALRVTAVHDPSLFRQILELARTRFRDDSASYHVSADLAMIPEDAQLEDRALSSLLDDDNARQVLHVTFGSALQVFRPELLELLLQHQEAHEAALERHFVRHLAPFAATLAAL